MGVTLHNPCLQATCVPLGGGDRSCTCPEGFIGDGMTCYGDILKVSKKQTSEVFLRLERNVSTCTLLFTVT